MVSKRSFLWLLFVGISLLFAVLAFIHFKFGNPIPIPHSDVSKWYPHFHFLIWPVFNLYNHCHWWWVFVLPVLILLIYREQVTQIVRRVYDKTISAVRGVYKNTIIKPIQWVFSKVIIDAPFIIKKTLLKIYRSHEMRLFVITVLVSLSLAEIILRIGFQVRPGMHTNFFWFKEVDSLQVLKGFCADENGITKIDSEAATYIATQLKQFSFPTRLPDIPSEKIMDIYALENDYWRLGDLSFHNEFADYLRVLRAKPSAERSNFENEIIHYSQCPINSDGYRSVAFKTYNTNKRKVLLLGDSFTWGHSTENKTSSFADILLARGYVVYNTGITCTDPTQYLAIAKKYIPLLKPDIVIVNFFMGNDVFYSARDPKPFMPVFYTTNAGLLLTCPGGVYFNSPQEAYQLSLSYGKIVQNSFFNRFCSLTSIGTLVWKGLWKYKLISINDSSFNKYWVKVKEKKQKTPVCNDEVRAIKEICEANNSTFYLSIIDDIMIPELGNPRKVPHLFEGLKYYESPVTIDGYNRNNYHYNDQGHKQYADFLEELISHAPDTISN